MRLIGLTSTLVLIGALPVLADELPSRKAGLWQLEMNIGGRIAQTMQQCIDAATDQMMQAGAGPVPRADCSKRDVQKSGNTITIDTACTVNGKPSTTHSVITGSFDSRLYDDVDLAKRHGAGRQDDHHDRRQMAERLRGGSEARRHDHVERHEDQHPEYAEGRRPAGRPVRPPPR